MHPLLGGSYCQLRKDTVNWKVKIIIFYPPKLLGATAVR